MSAVLFILLAVVVAIVLGAVSIGVVMAILFFGLGRLVSPPPKQKHGEPARQSFSPSPHHSATPRWTPPPARQPQASYEMSGDEASPVRSRSPGMLTFALVAAGFIGAALLGFGTIAGTSVTVQRGDTITTYPGVFPSPDHAVFSENVSMHSVPTVWMVLLVLIGIMLAAFVVVKLVMEMFSTKHPSAERHATYPPAATPMVAADRRRFVLATMTLLLAIPVGLFWLRSSTSPPPLHPVSVENLQMSDHEELLWKTSPASTKPIEIHRTASSVPVSQASWLKDVPRWAPSTESSMSPPPTIPPVVKPTSVVASPETIIEQASTEQNLARQILADRPADALRPVNRQSPAVIDSPAAPIPANIGEFTRLSPLPDWSIDPAKVPAGQAHLVSGRFAALAEAEADAHRQLAVWLVNEVQRRHPGLPAAPIDSIISSTDATRAIVRQAVEETEHQFGTVSGRMYAVHLLISTDQLALTGVVRELHLQQERAISQHRLGIVGGAASLLALLAWGTMQYSRRRGHHPAVVS
ncbi:MAG: hypothetical protein C0478_05385 [Planctomyces sp.]|nr:hypothetical protein [Planctomyces sp.]